MERSRTEQQRLKRKKRQRRARTLIGLSVVALVFAAGVFIWSMSQRDTGGQSSSAAAVGTSSASPASTSTAGPAASRKPEPSLVPSTPAPSSSVSKSQTGAAGGTATAKPAAGRPNAEEGPHVSMAFVGDVIFASTVETVLKQNGYDYPYTDLKDALQQPDITAANLETPITVRGEEQKKEYTYRSHPDALKAFKEAGFDVVGLANNHIMDYGTDGLLDTLKHLDKQGILRTGAGKNAKEAYTPAVVEKNGVKVAFLSFSHKVPDASWKAGVNKPGTTELYDPKKAMETITDVKKDADLVVVMAHWGVEREDKPQETHRTMARAFIDAGADLIIGSHPHVLQGLENYKGKWIAYSLGNFLFTTNAYEPSWETVILNADCTKAGGCSLSAIPVNNKFARPARMGEPEAKKLFERLTSISYGVRVDGDGRVEAKGG
jgi:poly-gamma-glutamate capsule biosynthesis protein CapA/YwtB (metallophosphatase superfamily)